VGGALAILAVAFGVSYAGLIMRFRRYKDVVAGKKKVKKVSVLAGDELTSWARGKMSEENCTEQELFAGTGPYNADKIWPLQSRVRVYKRMMWFFIVTLFCGTGLLAWLAYGVEVQVTGKAAARVLNPTQIPTGKPELK
jgi:hypothetical protein